MPSGHSPGASLTHKAVEADHFTTLSVPVVALDDYFAESDKVTLLKIDVEGAELGVFKGAERILRQHAPLLVFECENRHLAPGHVGRCLFVAREPRLSRQLHLPRPAKAAVGIRCGVHQRQHGEWFWKSRDYCNNFVFVEGRAGVERADRRFVAQPPSPGRARRADKAAPGGSRRPRWD